MTHHDEEQRAALRRGEADLRRRRKKKQMNDDGVDREWKRRAEIHRNPVPNFDELFDEKRKESIVMPPGGVVDEWIDKKREIHGNDQRW